MTFWTLVQAQWWDVRRNPMILMFTATIVGVAAVMSLMASAEAFEMVSGMMLVMSVYFVGYNLPSFTIAEEKEKRTLEALMLTPVRPLQIVAAKALLAVVLCLVAAGAILLIFGKAPANPGLLVLAYLLAMSWAISLGTLVGLVMPDLKSVGNVGTPFLLILLFATTLPWSLFQPTVWAVQTWLPTRPLVELIQAGYTGREVPVLQDVAVMAAYTGLLLWICARRLKQFTLGAR